MGLSPAVCEVIRAAGWEKPTPIQARSIPPALQGLDVIGAAQTGTGKTGAFVLPMIHRLMLTAKPSTRTAAQKATLPPKGIVIRYGGVGVRNDGPVVKPNEELDPSLRARPRGLVIAPTRELAQQTYDQAVRFGKPQGIASVVLVGGVPLSPQSRALADEPEIVVATPGRLLDHVERGTMTMDAVEILVLDEADRMLDMGFADQIDLILEGVPSSRQTLLFSATMPAGIHNMSKTRMKDPVRIQIGLNTTPPARTEQAVYLAKGHDEKTSLLLKLLEIERGSVLVFCRTKSRAEKLAQQLRHHNFHAARIHSDLTQGQRERALDGFRSGYYRILVATDVASRGIDIDHIAHVVNYDLPLSPEDYVHRVGRTARAERSGRATSFAAPDERKQLAAIESAIGQQVPRVTKMQRSS